LIDDLFAFMRYERDCWRLQVDELPRHQMRSYRMNANRSSFNS